MTHDYIESVVKGTLVGLLIGDSIGYSYSNVGNVPSEINMITGPGGELPGEYTSLGALSLATVVSLNECETLDPDDLMDKFYDVYIAGYLTSDANCYDVGSTTAQAIQNFSNGMPTDRCGLETNESNDGDCLTRMLPIILYYINEPVSVIVPIVHTACMLTHKHIRSQVACAIYCLIIQNLILQKAEKVFDTLRRYYINQEMQEHVSALDQLKSWTDIKTSQETPQDLYLIENSFWTAWSAFAKYENDIMFSVTEAIQKGKDRNLAGALAGSFATAANGLSDIPIKWLHTLRLTSEVMEVITEFTNIIANRMISDS